MTDNAESQQPSKRRLTRHSISGFVEVYDCNGQQSLGRLVNIHREGLMLISDNLMSVEKIYQCELIFPEMIAGCDRIHLGIDCLWVREAETEASHWAGCRIIDASDDALMAIEALVELLGE